ncbi:MATE family efflux transporter [Rhodovulum sp. DZ06]|uniref:MATE family efflux transporter n=1 Tax=Rhodovulum sp. DZ06 TaxID=3425126 RepID=UPI003D350CA9
MLSNVTVPLLGAVDTGVVGQLGAPEPIGAVGVGAVIIAFIYWMFGFLRMGTTGLVAQARGQGDAAETGALLTRALLIAAAGGLAVAILQPLLIPLALMLSPASEGVEEMTRQYLSIRMWGAPCAIAVYALTGWLIAMEKTRGVLLLQVGMNGMNIGLDLWFVLGLGWGVEGVAAATVMSEVAGAALGLYLCRAAFAGGAWKDRARVLDPAKLRRLAQVNGDILLRSALLSLAFLLFVFSSADAGDVTLAANQVLYQFFTINAYALDGFAFAAEAMVGAAFGARDPATVRAAARVASLWAFAAAAAIAALFLVFGPAIIDLMTTDPETRARARVFLLWAAASPVIGLPCFMLDGIFIGATRTRDMRVGMIESFAIYLPLLFGLGWALGPHGLWAALMGFFVARAVTLWRRWPGLLEAAKG